MSPGGKWTLKRGNIVFNERKATTLAYSPKKFSHYTDFMDLIHPEDYDKAMGAMQDHLKGNSSQYKVDYHIQTKNGKYKWYRDVGGITERDPEGHPVKTTGLVIDISERMEIERNMRILHRWAQFLNRAHSMEEIFKYTLDALDKTFGYSHIAILLKQEQFLKFEATRGYESIPKELEELSLAGKGITVKAANEKKTIVIHDVHNHHNYLFASPTIKSELAVPIKTGDDVLGIINVESDHPHHFDEKDQLLVETLASHVAVAMKGVKRKRNGPP